MDSAHVRLPACPECGSRMLVRVAFDEDELKNPNSVTYGYVDEDRVLPHAITGEPVPVRIPAFKPIGGNAGIARHQELAKLLEKHGKRPKEKNQ